MHDPTDPNTPPNEDLETTQELGLSQPLGRTPMTPDEAGHAARDAGEVEDQ